MSNNRPNTDAPIVHVIDDDGAFLTAVSRLLRASGYQVKTFSSAGDFLVQLGQGARGCVVTDLQLPEMNGLELQAALAESGHALPVVFLSGKGDIPSTVLAMQGGAEDFLEKLASKERLLGAVQRALNRDTAGRETGYQRRKLQDRFDCLTRRELEVLEHVVRGQLNKQIAAALGISERTVKAHRSAITSKMGVRSVAELTRLTLNANLFAHAPDAAIRGQAGCWGDSSK
jgi:two-component system response regulator FixJ